MRPSSTAKRYADAAFDVAKGGGGTKVYLEELRTATQTLQNASVGRYFKDPNIGREDKLRTVSTLFGNLGPHVLNLLRILTVKQRLHLLPGIVREFEGLQREAEGIAEAHVTVARALTETEKQEVTDRLGQVTGKTVEVHTNVDPSILGGIVVRIGDKLIDASVAGRLQRLRRQIAM